MQIDLLLTGAAESASPRGTRARGGAAMDELDVRRAAALAIHEGVLYVGTYGGGIARHALGDWVTANASAAVPALVPFVETEGWKVNPGTLAAWNGRCYAGTDGQGLFRLARDGSRFEPVAVTLPSSRVTALTATPEALYIGTDQGVAMLASELE